MIEASLKPLVCSKFLEDKKYRDWHCNIMNVLPGREILGLHIPEMKAFAKSLLKSGEAEAVVRGFETLCEAGGYQDKTVLYYEEQMVWGYLVDYMKVPLAERFRMVGRFVPAIDSWGVCDSFCGAAKWMGKTDKEVLWDFLQGYYDSTSEFHVRFALISSMSYFLDEDWTDRVLRRVESIDYDRIVSEYKGLESPYYVRMGAAWLLATALARFPEKTRDFVSSSAIPESVRRLYVRKARESFRTRTIPALNF